MTVEDRLENIRESIDEADKELLKLLNRRMELAYRVGRIKADQGLLLFDPGREETILDRLAKANHGPSWKRPCGPFIEKSSPPQGCFSMISRWLFSVRNGPTPILPHCRSTAIPPGMFLHLPWRTFSTTF